jgi:chromosome segregation ATPase
MLFVYKLSNNLNTDIYLGYTSKQLDIKLRNHITSYNSYKKNDTVDDKKSLYDLFDLVEPSEWSIEKISEFKTKGECIDYIRYLNNIQNECVLQDKEDRVNRLEIELNTRSLSSMMEETDISDKKKQLDEQSHTFEIKMGELIERMRSNDVRENELNTREEKLAHEIEKNACERDTLAQERASIAQLQKNDNSLETKLREQETKLREQETKLREQETKLREQKSIENELRSDIIEIGKKLKEREDEINRLLSSRETDLKSYRDGIESDLKSRELKLKKQLEKIEAVQAEMDEREDRLDAMEAKVKEDTLPPITTKDEQITYTKKKVSLTGQINRATRTLTTLKDDNPVKAELKQSISVWQKQLDLYVKALKECSF